MCWKNSIGVKCSREKILTSCIGLTDEKKIELSFIILSRGLKSKILSQTFSPVTTEQTEDTLCVCETTHLPAFGRSHGNLVVLFVLHNREGAYAAVTPIPVSDFVFESQAGLEPGHVRAPHQARVHGLLVPLHPSDTTIIAKTRTPRVKPPLTDKTTTFEPRPFCRLPHSRRFSMKSRFAVSYVRKIRRTKFTWGFPVLLRILRHCFSLAPCELQIKELLPTMFLLYRSKNRKKINK